MELGVWKELPSILAMPFPAIISWFVFYLSSTFNMNKMIICRVLGSL